jgi:hypothetical protein
MICVFAKYSKFIILGGCAVAVALISAQGNTLLYPPKAPAGSQIFQIEIKPTQLPPIAEAAKDWVVVNNGVPSTTIAVATWHRAVAPALAAQKSGRLIVLNGNTRDVYAVFENFSRLGIKTYTP